jgi:hypothetical protein
MFKKINFNRLNYKDLDGLNPHDLKTDEMRLFYETFDFLELIKKWPEIVGPGLTSVTSPLKIQYGALYIVTKHASFSHHLFSLSEDIKNQIFKIFPELKKVIKKLEFRTQEGFFKNETPRKETSARPSDKPHPQSPAYKMKKLEAERLFGDFPDEEMKKMLISIYIQSK